jgi:hypothetical protein
MSKRVLIGAFKDGGYGVRVSQPGYDVTSNPVDNSKLVFNSDWQDVLAFAVDTNGNPMTAGINAPTANTIYSYTHNLGYIPFIAAYVNINGQGWEHYHSSNMLLSKYVKMSKWTGVSVQQYFFSNQNDTRPYSFDGNVGTQVQIKVNTSQVTCLCSQPAKFYIIVYKARAF